MPNINKTGYKKGTPTEDNTYNVIPSGDITMEGVEKELLAMKRDKDGNIIGFEFMKPNKNYNFKNTESVVEIPKYQLGNMNQFSPPVDQSLQGFQAQYPYLNEQQPNQNLDNLFQTNLTTENTALNYQFPTGSLSIQTNPITGEEVKVPESNISELELRKRNQTQFFNPYGGVDIPTAASKLGENIGNNNTLGTIGSGLKLASGLARNIFGAMGRQNRENQVMQNYLDEQKQDFNRLEYIGKKGGYYQEGGSNLKKEDFDILNQSLRNQGATFDFTEDKLNELFEKVERTPAPQVPDVNLGKYSDIGYFDIIQNRPDSVQLQNTSKSPHTQETINQVLKQLRELNPGRSVNVSFQQGGSIDQIIGNDFEQQLLESLSKQSQNGNTNETSLNLGEYGNLGYFDVLENEGKYTLRNTENNPQNAESIKQQLRKIRQINPDVDITFKYNPKLQQGGNIDEILRIFEEEKIINKIDQPKEFNLGKYKDLNYFDVDTMDGKYVIKNTENNPQNAQGFKEQLEQLRKENPNAIIVQKYLPKLQKGGSIDEELLTGEYITGLPEGKEQMANGEVESGEYYQTNQGDIAEVKGKKHSQGGELMMMEKGDRVLTDHTKLGAKHAKMIRDDYDLDIKASHTYSDVLDKFRSKMGLNKLVDEEEKLIEKLQKEQEKDDSQSKKLNINYLSDKINEITKKKEPIEEARKVLYNRLFDLQEGEKEEELKKEFKSGGIQKMAMEYGIGEDKAYEMFKQFKKGGYYAQEGLDTDKKKVETEVVGGVNPYDIESDFVNQSRGEGIFFGKANAQRLEALEENFPLLVQQTFDIKRDDQGNIIDASLKEGQSVLNFQKAVDANYQALINDAERLGDPSRVEAFKDKVLSERFNTQLVARDFDDKIGNFTSSRPNFGFRSVTPEDLKKLQDKGITTYKQLVDDSGNIRDDIDLTPESKKLLEKFKGSESDFLLGDKEVIAGSPESTKSLERIDNIIKDEKVDKRVLNVPLLPDQYPLQPGSLEPHLKVERIFDRTEAQQIDPEPFLEQIFQQQSVANRQLEGLSPSMKAAAQANITANTQKNINDVMLKIEGANQQARQQSNFRNSDIQRMEENARGQDALNYEKRQLLAKSIYDQNINNYFKKLQDTNVRNFKEVQNLNFDNAMFDDIQYQGDGTFSVSEAPDFKSQIDALFATKGVKQNNK